jgi:hypothetical protein
MILMLGGGDVRGLENAPASEHACNVNSGSTLAGEVLGQQIVPYMERARRPARPLHSRMTRGEAVAPVERRVERLVRVVRV